MSTVLAFNPVSDLGAAEVNPGDVTLTWSAVTPIYVLVNMGAELANTSGWTVTVGSLFNRGNGSQNLVAPEGTRVFDSGQNNATTKAHQRFCPLSEGLTIDQIDNDTLTITMDWWGGRYNQAPGDQPQLNLHFYDEDDVLISTYNSGYKDPATLIGTQYRWTEYQDTPTIPVGTRFINIEIEGKRRVSGGQTYNDACFDDIRYTLEDAAALPFVPGYAIYQNGVLVATAPANAESYELTGLADGDYEFQVVPYDGTNFLGDTSNLVEITLNNANPVEDAEYPVIAFNDEEVYGGYLGGKLRGKVVACPGRNAPTIKSDC